MLRNSWILTIYIMEAMFHVLISNPSHLYEGSISIRTTVIGCRFFSIENTWDKSVSIDHTYIVFYIQGNLVVCRTCFAWPDMSLPILDQWEYLATNCLFTRRLQTKLNCQGGRLLASIDVMIWGEKYSSSAILPSKSTVKVYAK